MGKAVIACIAMVLCQWVSAQVVIIPKESLDSIEPVEIIFSDKDTFSYFTLDDSQLDVYTLPKKFTKPDNWLKADKRNSKGEHYGGKYDSTFNLEKALHIIDTEKKLYLVCAAKSWCLKNYKEAFPHLVARLGVKQKIGLINTADLIIWDRNATGDLTFYGHGGCIKEDIFTVSGRASWILNALTGEEFAVVHANLTRQQAIDFKKDWAKFIEGLK